MPLQLKCHDDILRQNPVPSSTLFFLPIYFQFKKETTQLCQDEDESIGNKIKHPLNVSMDNSDTNETTQNVTMQIAYDLHHTMVDQKVINSLTDTKSSMRCYICGATPTQFNNIANLPKPTKPKEEVCMAFLQFISGFAV